MDPRLSKFVECSEFLSQLVGLGLRSDKLHVIEDAYWAFLRDGGPELEQWGNESPFIRPNSLCVDHAKSAEVLGTVAAQLCETPGIDAPEDIGDAYYSLLHCAAGLSAQQLSPELQQKVKRFSVQTFINCAVFIVLARRAGVFENHQAELEQLVLEAVRE